MNKLVVGTDLDAALYGADKITEDDYLVAIATGRQLREARRARGMTQIDMADLLGVTQSQISVWETGAEDIPRKHGMRIIDLLNNRRGQFDPFLRHLLPGWW